MPYFLNSLPPTCLPSLQAVSTHLVPTRSFSTIYNWPPSACHLFESGSKQQDYVYLRDLLRGHCLSVLPLAGGCTAGLPAGVVPPQGVVWPGSGGPGTLLSPALGGQRTGPVTAMAFHPHQPLLAAAGADYWAVYELYDPQVRQETAGYGRVPVGVWFFVGRAACGPAEVSEDGATSLRGVGIQAVLRRCGIDREAEGRTRDSGCSVQPCRASAGASL